jgi:hypothetical protein
MTETRSFITPLRIPAQSQKSQYTLFGKDGTAVFSTQTSVDKNSVKDVCKYLTKVAHDRA